VREVALEHIVGFTVTDEGKSFLKKANVIPSLAGQVKISKNVTSVSYLFSLEISMQTNLIHI
jgi:hypothetical protein